MASIRFVKGRADRLSIEATTLKNATFICVKARDVDFHGCDIARTGVLFSTISTRTPQERSIGMSGADLTLTMLAALVLISLVGFIMKRATGYNTVIECVADEGMNDTPLYRRFSYNADDAALYWGALDKTTRSRELAFLLADLFFPLAYGAVFVIAMRFVHDRALSTLPAHYYLLPVIAVVVADWAENFILLTQFDKFLRGGRDAISDVWIRLASIATDIKILSFLGSFVMIVVVWLKSREGGA